MASQVYSDKVGVAEIRGRYEEALRLIGKQDKQGRTIGIAYFGLRGLMLVPLILRTFVFIFILSLVVFHQPFAWLPISNSTPGWMRAVHDWEVFSLGTWLMAVVIYALYFVVHFLKNSIFPGLPGAEIHFERHKKIVKTIRPGERALLLDPRVKPYAVVSCKPIPLEMPTVEGKTRDNIHLEFRGALIIRIRNTYKLLVEGGFENFVKQLKRTYESTLKDLIVSVDAKDFNRFLIEDVDNPTPEKENVSKKLERLGNTDLTLEFLSDLTEIDEIDVSEFDLTESGDPQRRSILDGLQGLADHYGLEVVDHLPLGNTTSEDYLRSLALPLANSITRLEQSTDTLKEITEEEISEEISANVADKEIGVLEIQKIIKQIESITETLKDRQNEESIVQAKEVAMGNAQQGILVPQLSAIESLIAQVQAKTIDTAGLERYMAETQELLDWIEAELENFVPHIDRVVVDKMDAGQIIPDFDVLNRMLEISGTQKAFDALKKQAEGGQEYEGLEDEIKSVEGKAEAFNAEESMKDVQGTLHKITSDSGIYTEDYTPENVRKRINQIARDADLNVAESETVPAEAT